MRFGGILLIFLLGLAAGVGLPYITPHVPFLSLDLQGPSHMLEGTVVRKLREDDRLLLTISTPQGAILATFTSQSTEVDLLIDQGDGVGLAIRHYEPFMDDPKITQVMKHTSESAREAPTASLQPSEDEERTGPKARDRLNPKESPPSPGR